MAKRLLPKEFNPSAPIPIPLARFTGLWFVDRCGLGFPSSPISPGSLATQAILARVGEGWHGTGVYRWRSAIPDKYSVKGGFLISENFVFSENPESPVNLEYSALVLLLLL